jgi:hypothetical protein
MAMATKLSGSDSRTDVGALEYNSEEEEYFGLHSLDRVASLRR